jgi:ketosteroid isomerase-like protein
MTRTLLVLTLTLALIATTAAEHHTAMDRATADATAIENTVNAYHEALKNKDSAAAVALLSDQVIVLESGYIENHEEYLGHHLGADMEFSASVPGTRTVKHVEVNGNAGWVIATSTSKGTFRERDINSAGVELIVVARDATDGTWKIKAIHWSSRKVKE